MIDFDYVKSEVLSAVTPEFLANFIARQTGETATLKANGEYRIGKERGNGSIVVGRRGGKVTFCDFADSGCSGDVFDAYQIYSGVGFVDALRDLCYAHNISLELDAECPCETKKNILGARDIIESRGLTLEFIKTQNVGYLDGSKSPFMWNGIEIRHRSLVFWNDDKPSKCKVVPFRLMDGVWRRGTDIRQYPAGTGQFHYKANARGAKTTIVVEGEFDALTLAYCGFNAVAAKEPVLGAMYSIFDSDNSGDTSTDRCGLRDIREALTQKDPNDTLLDIGAGAFTDRIKKAIESALIREACIHPDVPFSAESDAEFKIDKDLYDSASDNRLAVALRDCYRFIGRCNGKFVVKKDEQLISASPDQLLAHTVFYSKNVAKRIKGEARKDLSDLLCRILNSHDMKYIPVKPRIPEYADKAASEAFADKIIMLYEDYVDKKKTPSIKQYMRVMGYILSGDFWAKKDKRFFVNIVSADTGIGKTKLLVKSMLKNVCVAYKEIPQKETINQFTFADCSTFDVLCFDDITDENVPRLTPLLTNVVSNAAMESEHKGKQSVQVADYKALVIATGNKEMVINEPTGLTRQKRLLLKFINTRPNSKNMAMLSSQLVTEATQHNGIESAFLRRCVQAYNEDPDITDLLCCETPEELNNRYFDIFKAIYQYSPSRSAYTKGLINLARAYSEAFQRDTIKSLYRGDTGRLNTKKIMLDFNDIIQTIRNSAELAIEFKPACLIREVVDGICWSGKTKNRAEEKNCLLTDGDWKRIQAWLASIDPANEDERQQEIDDWRDPFAEDIEF